MATDSARDSRRRSLVARLRERNGDARPHLVVCGSDALVYTLADELATTGRIRLTVITPLELRPAVPDLDELRARGVRVITAARLDERTFRDAGLEGAAALALVMPDDMVNLHAALCARAVEGDLRLVIRMFTTGLASGVRKLFADCAVLSDAAMAAPAFVAAALGEVAPTHFRYAARTLTVARRGDVPAKSVLLTLATFDDAGRMTVLPAEPEPTGPAVPTTSTASTVAAAATVPAVPTAPAPSTAPAAPTGRVVPAGPQPGDLVLAEATGRPAAQAVTARRLARAGRRRRPWLSIGRALRIGLTRKLGIAVLVALALTAISGILLARFTGVDGFWKSIYITLLTVVGSSDVEPDNTPAAQAAQLVLTIAGVALLPLITAAVVDGVVKTRLALDRGAVLKVHSGHIVLVGLGTVGTRVLRQLTDLGLDVVAIDRNPTARGVKVAESLGVPVITGDAAREETLRAASIHHCQALVVVSTDDAVNLQAALHARAAREDIRVVLRLFDDDFAQRVQAAFNINISRSVSRLCAPAFAAAMLEREVLATIPVERHALLVAVVRVMPGAALDGAPLDRAERPESTRVIGMTAAGAEWVDWLPDGRRVLAAGDEIVVVARRAGLRALRAEAAGSAAGE